MSFEIMAIDFGCASGFHFFFLCCRDEGAGLVLPRWYFSL
jgi:hypothetical protein